MGSNGVQWGQRCPLRMFKLRIPSCGCPCGSAQPPCIRARGLIGLKIRQKENENSFLVFYVILEVIGGFNYSQMASFDSRMDCNHFWNIFGTTTNVPKMRSNLDPRNPYLSPKYFRNGIEYGNMLETYFHI